MNEEAFKYNEETTSLLMQVCEPLFKNTPIKSFQCGTFFKGGDKYTLLSTDKEWAKYQFQTTLPRGNTFPDLMKILPLEGLYYFLWPSDPTADANLSTFYDFNVWHGLSICKREKDTVRFWAFATDRENSQMNNFYINNKGLLERFLVYLDQKGASFINPPHKSVIAQFEKGVDMVPNEDPSLLFNGLFEDESLQKELHQDKKILSPREFECLFNLSCGKTAKEIANILSLKPRTVESYIDNIRLKIGYRRKVELINFFQGTLEKKFQL